MHTPSLSLCHTLAALCALSAVACGAPDEADRVHAGPINGPFLVSDYFTPSGDMGDGQFPGHLTTDFDDHCKARPAGAQGDCYRFTYVPGSALWAGVYWVYPSNSWGAYPGRDVVGPVDLGNGQRSYTSVNFYAASDTPLSANFIAGGIYGDQAVPPLPYSDQFKATQGASLTADWQQVSIDISQTPVTEVIGAFAWSTGFPNGIDPSTAPTEVIYLDDLVWE